MEQNIVFWIVLNRREQILYDNKRCAFRNFSTNCKSFSEWYYTSLYLFNLIKTSALIDAICMAMAMALQNQK